MKFRVRQLCQASKASKFYLSKDAPWRYVIEQRYSLFYNTPMCIDESGEVACSPRSFPDKETAEEALALYLLKQGANA